MIKLHQEQRAISVYGFHLFRVLSNFELGKYLLTIIFEVLLSKGEEELKARLREGSSHIKIFFFGHLVQDAVANHEKTRAKLISKELI